MTDDLRARVLAEVARTPSLSRAQTRQRAYAIIAVGALTTVAFFIATGGVVRGARPPNLVAFTAGLGLVLGVLSTWLVLGSRSMLGRPRAALATGVLATSAALALVVAAASSIWPSDEDVPRTIDAACGALTIAQGAIPLAAFLLPRRGADPVHPILAGAAIGAAAGAWALMLAYLRCPHATLVHGLVAHAGPGLVLAAVGAGLGWAILRLR
jgi:hypothetical protein